MQYTRDGAMTALILGFFASSWFGWAQEKPPPGWRSPLIVGAVLSLMVGAVCAWRNWSGGSALNEPGAMRHYGIIVGVEFGTAAAGAVALALWGRGEYASAWVCLVVGAHFWPMAPVLKSPSLVALGVLLTVVAAAAVFVSRQTGIAASAVAGAGAGVALLGFASWAAVSVIA